MIVFDEGTECSSVPEVSVSAYGFIDRKSKCTWSASPCLDQSVLDRHFQTYDDGDNLYGGSPVYAYENYSFAPWRGFESCDFCERKIDDDGKLVRGRKAWCGVVVIPSRNLLNQYYLFPVLLGHLIEDHNYQPPDDLLHALRNFEFDPNWHTRNYEHKLFHVPSSIRSILPLGLT